MKFETLCAFAKLCSVVLLIGISSISTRVHAQAAQGTTAEPQHSFWYRLSSDDRLPTNTMAVIDFVGSKVPSVRVNPDRSSGQELEIVRRILTQIFRDSGQQFPDRKRLMIPRPTGAMSPDTLRAHARGRAQLASLRKQARWKQGDRSAPSVVMSLVVDKRE